MKQKKKPWMLLMNPVKILVSPLEMPSTNVCTCPSKLKNENEGKPDQVIAISSDQVLT